MIHLLPFLTVLLPAFTAAQKPLYPDQQVCRFSLKTSFPAGSVCEQRGRVTDPSPLAGAERYGFGGSTRDCALGCLNNRPACSSYSYTANRAAAMRCEYFGRKAGPQGFFLDSSSPAVWADQQCYDRTYLNQVPLRDSGFEKPAANAWDTVVNAPGVADSTFTDCGRPHRTKTCAFVQVQGQGGQTALLEQDFAQCAEAIYGLTFDLAQGTTANSTVPFTVTLNNAPVQSFTTPNAKNQFYQGYGPFFFQYARQIPAVLQLGVEKSADPALGEYYVDNVVIKYYRSEDVPSGTPVTRIN